jgi:hypothetical protein
MKQITDQQLDKLYDLNASDPVPLGLADLSKPFVYDREYGVFYVAPGYHPAVMSQLLAMAHGCLNQSEVGRLLGLRDSHAMADRWLESQVGAYRSSVSNKVVAGRRGRLTPIERRLLGEVHYLLTDEN